MKSIKYLLSTVVLLAFTTFAYADFSAGLYGYNQNTDCNSGCGMNIEDSNGAGYIFSATTNGDVYFGGDVFGGQGGNNSFQGADLKVGVKVSSFNLSAGGGVIDDHVSATNSPRFSSVAADTDSAKFVFVEVEHNSGVFVRYSQIDENQEYTLAKVSNGVVVDRQDVKADLTRDLIFVGYRFHF